MAKNENAEEHEPLTEEQRITALEQKVGTNKVVLIGMALFLIVIITVSVTIFSLTSLNGDVAVVAPEEFLTLQEEVSSLNLLIEQQNTKLQKTKNSVALFEEQLSNSSNKTLQEIILNQEKGHQEFLSALRSGMYDLAHMVHGSRTWLDVYTEKVDKANMNSQTREKDIKRLLTNEPNESEEDSFF